MSREEGGERHLVNLRNVDLTDLDIYLKTVDISKHSKDRIKTLLENVQLVYNIGGNLL